MESSTAGLPGRYTDAIRHELQTRKFASKGDRTRRRLEFAALIVLETTGYSEMRISDICAEASVALGTFYVYYKDKTDIARKVLLEFGEALYAHGLRAATGKNAYEAVLLTNRFFVLAYDENRGLVRCLVQVDDVDPVFQERWRKCRYAWVRRIAASIAKRSASVQLTEATRFQIANALEGMVFHFLYDLFVREEPHLKAVATEHEQIAELLSLLWYRALFATNPEEASVNHELTALSHRA